MGNRPQRYDEKKNPDKVIKQPKPAPGRVIKGPGQK